MAKIALCYDRINKFGGAERVLQSLHEIWPDAPVYTLTYNQKNASWAKGWTIRSSFLQKIPVLGNKHEYFPALAPLAWEQFNFSEFDVVISVTSSEAKSIITRPYTLHICYCLTPTRYLWSGYFEYLKSPGFGRIKGVVRKFLSVLSVPLRVWDFFSAARPDIFIGISDEVCERIKKYYRREPIKIYPPAGNVKLSGSSRLEISDKPYFLVISRLVPYKRIDVVVEAFNHLGWPLKIVGVGSELENLRAKAKDNIEFMGFLDDTAVASYYSSCIAVIFPSHEDFGIVPVEAQSYGKPVVAYRGGGALETVVEGRTGLFFDEQSSGSLISLFLKICSEPGDRSLKIESVNAYFKKFDELECKRNAARFSKEQFQDKIRKLVEL